MNSIANIIEPRLLLHKEKCLRNIRRMVEKAKINKVQLRPHFKTHQSKEIAEWFRSENVKCATVSSIKMATYFAEAGWDDITVAFPINVLEYERINRLAKRIQLNLIAVGTEGIKALLTVLKYPVNIFIKIDVGYGRTGVLPYHIKEIDSILALIASSDLLYFSGFLSHAGHSYNCRSQEEIIQLHFETIQTISLVADIYRLRYPELLISVGDTPTCSVADDFSMVDEIRPGNFVFYDLTQANIGSNAKSDIAIALACPLVAKHPDRNEVVLYGGGVHFSKDALVLNNGLKIYGELVWLTENDWSEPVEGCYIKSISQEHGILKLTEAVFNQVKVGDVLAILPVHSCMTANLMNGYTILQGGNAEYFNFKREYFLG